MKANATTITTTTTTTRMDQKVRELLGFNKEEEEDNTFGLGRRLTRRPPPLVDVYSSRSCSPFSTPSTAVRRVLTPREEQCLIDRLYCKDKKESTSSPPVCSDKTKRRHRMINAHSAQLTEGLEPIELRAAKLIRARERRMEQLAFKKSQNEDENITGKPVINATSRRIAERLSPEDRARLVEARRRILLEEARLREQEHCVFQPVTTKSSRSSRRTNKHVEKSAGCSSSLSSCLNVTLRLSRDAEARKRKQELNEKERVVKEMAQCKETPEITKVAKSLFRDLSVPSVHHRLFPTTRSRRSTSMSAPVAAGRMVYSYSEFFSAFDDPYPIQPVSRATDVRRGTHYQDLSEIFSFTTKQTS